MHKSSYTVVALILLIILYSISYTSVNSSSEEIIRLYDARYKTIPDTLPWYPIIVFGDNRPENTSDWRLPSIFYEIIDEINEINPIAVIGTGDHVGIGYEYQYQELYRVFNETSLENIWMAIGNHDVDSPDGLNNWLKYIGPEYYYVDDIPGWRIAVVNSETRIWSSWKNQVLVMYENLSNRSMVFVFHRPVYPSVEHNMRSDYARTLLNIFKEKGYPKIVLQGHWHGWGYQVVDNTTWIVTGGAGAPLYTYSVPQPENGEVVLGRHHYVVLILYPNQTFEFYPVLAGYGSVSVVRLNSTTYIVRNTKLDIHGDPVEMPVRIKYHVYGYELDTVLIAPPNSIVAVNYSVDNGVVRVMANTSNWYVYLYILRYLLLNHF
jgi:hypothetical protein